MLCTHPSRLQCYAPIPPDWKATPNKRFLSRGLSFASLISVIPSVDWGGNTKEEEAMVLTTVMAGTAGAELWQWISGSCSSNNGVEKRGASKSSDYHCPAAMWQQRYPRQASKNWPCHAQWRGGSQGKKGEGRSAAAEGGCTTVKRRSLALEEFHKTIGS